MNSLTKFQPNFLQESIVYTLIDSIWQAAFIVIALWIANRIFKPGPQIKYLSSLMGLFSVVVLGLGNFLFLILGEKDGASIFIGQIVNGLDASIIFWVFTAWMIGTVIFSIRFLLSHLFLKKLIHQAQHVIQPTWLDRFDRIKEHYNIQKNILLMHSDRISSAFLTGVVKPIIVIPTAWVNGLQPKEIECILAHEISHICSKDHWINFFVQLTELLFYFNPAVQMLISHIKLDRELLADAHANEYVKAPIIYAKLILKAEEQKGLIPLFSIPFFKQKNQLRRRIESVLNIQSAHTSRESRISLFATLGCLLFLGLNPELNLKTTGKMELIPLYNISYKAEPNPISIPSEEKDLIRHTSMVPKVKVVNKSSRSTVAEVSKTAQHKVIKKEPVKKKPEVVVQNVQRVSTSEDSKKSGHAIIIYTPNEIRLDSLSMIEGDGAWIISKQGMSYQPRSSKSLIIYKTGVVKTDTSEKTLPDTSQEAERGTQTN